MASGCAITPYEQSFQCPLSSDFGTCTDVSGAYADAVSAPPAREGGIDVGRSRPSARSWRARPLHDRDDVAQRVAVVAPTVPIVKPPTLLRTLILGYRDADRTLYAGRYVFHLAGNSVLEPASENVPQVPIEPARTVLPLPTDAR
jgi:conjugal transfer pilus assembly protein TraV